MARGQSRLTGHWVQRRSGTFGLVGAPSAAVPILSSSTGMPVELFDVGEAGLLENIEVVAARSCTECGSDICFSSAATALSCSAESPRCVSLRVYGSS